MTIKEWIFNRRLKRQEKQPVRFPNWERVHNIIVLYESDIMEKNPSIRRIVNELHEEGKDVTILGYVPRKDVSSANLPQSRMLGQKDFGWLGGLKQEVADDIRTRHYDLKIDLSIRNELAMKYIAMYLLADFKVGRNFGEGIHNMLINLTPTSEDDPVAVQEELYREIIRYLKMIKSND